MDISDILAEVDGNAVPQETRDLQELTRAWVTERSAPEILPWPGALLERVLDRIRRQVTLISSFKVSYRKTDHTIPRSSS